MVISFVAFLILPFDIKKDAFLKHLSSSKTTADWQIKQAETAIRLYVGHFLKGDISKLSPNSYQKEQGKFGNLSYIIGKMRQALRLKHYSYRTERS